MPLSSNLAPGFIRMTYSGIMLPHHMVIPIKFEGVPTPGESPILQTSSGGSVDWLGGLISFVTLALAPCYPTTAKFGLADIYSVDPDTGIRNFIYTGNVNEEGSAVTAAVNSGEGIFVFKTTAGRPLKVYLMEPIFAVGSRNIGEVPADARQGIVDFVLSEDNIFYGRTDAWPLAFQTFTSKTNDVLRRRQGFTDV